MSENRKHEATLRLARLDSLSGEIEKLNRKARKLDLPELVVAETAREVRPVLRRDPLDPDGPRIPTGAFETWVTVAITGESPKLEGWEFLGTLDHSAGDTVVRNAPGCEIPAEFWSAARAGVCDHCGFVRSRKETFVVRNVASGEHKQVGRRCVSDFLGGKSVEAAVWLATRERELGSVLDDDYGYEYGGNCWREPILFDADRALAIAVRVVNEYGFASRRDVECRGGESTSNRVMNILWPPPAKYLSQQERDAASAEMTRCTPTDDDKARAVLMKEWLASVDPAGSSYVQNLKVIAARGLVQPKELGFLASLVPYYAREAEKVVKGQAKVAPSEHIGTEKERLDLDVECVGIGSCEGQFGEIVIYRFKSGGNKLTWFSSSEDREIEVGGHYKVKATIKRHDEFRGEKVTMVNRVKVVERVAASAAPAAPAAAA